MRGDGENPGLDYSLSTAWLKKSSFSSCKEGYILAIDEQEIARKATAIRKEKGPKTEVKVIVNVAKVKKPPIIF